MFKHRGFSHSVAVPGLMLLMAYVLYKVGSPLLSAVVLLFCGDKLGHIIRDWKIL